MFWENRHSELFVFLAFLLSKIIVQLNILKLYLFSFTFTTFMYTFQNKHNDCKTGLIVRFF